MTCDGKNFVGWPCDEQEEDLRQQYIQETDPEKQRALVEAMHRRLWQVIPYAPLGQLKQPFCGARTSRARSRRIPSSSGTSKKLSACNGTTRS
jgi:hypothetical protein